MYSIIKFIPNLPESINPAQMYQYQVSKKSKSTFILHKSFKAILIIKSEFFVTFHDPYLVLIFNKSDNKEIWN